MPSQEAIITGTTYLCGLQELQLQKYLFFVTIKPLCVYLVKKVIDLSGFFNEKGAIYHWGRLYEHII